MTIHTSIETRQLPESLAITLPPKLNTLFWLLFDRAGYDGWVAITQRDLAFSLGIHVNSVFSYLWKLNALGLIENGYARWRVAPTVAALVAGESHE